MNAEAVLRQGTVVRGGIARLRLAEVLEGKGFLLFEQVVFLGGNYSTGSKVTPRFTHFFYTYIYGSQSIQIISPFTLSNQIIQNVVI